MREFLAEHRRLVEQGDTSGALRFSGENLAMAEQRLVALRESPASDDAKCRAAVEFLTVAAVHLCDLGYAGMERDEAALSVSVAATLLVMKVNPEAVGDAYIHWLQMTVGRLGDILPSLGAVVLEEAFWQVAVLAVVTCDAFAARMEVDESLLSANRRIKAMLAAAERDDTTFEGRPIVPQMAIDIFFNMLGIMGSLGWIE